jgi:hypothetical protein
MVSKRKPTDGLQIPRNYSSNSIYDSEVLTTVKMSMLFFRVVKPCGLNKVHTKV